MRAEHNLFHVLRMAHKARANFRSQWGEFNPQVACCWPFLCSNFGVNLTLCYLEYVFYVLLAHLSRRLAI